MEKKRLGCGTYLIVWIVVTGVMTLILERNNETGQLDVEVTLTSMAMGFLAAVILFVIRKASAGIKASMEKRRQRKEDQANGISRYQGILHVGGLDAPENCRAAFVLSPDNLMVTCGVREYILKIKKIKSLEFRYDVNETKYMQSHLRLGLVGALMAGDSEINFWL